MGGSCWFLLFLSNRENLELVKSIKFIVLEIDVFCRVFEKKNIVWKVAR